MISLLAAWKFSGKNIFLNRTTTTNISIKDLFQVDKVSDLYKIKPHESSLRELFLIKSSALNENDEETMT